MAGMKGGLDFTKLKARKKTADNTPVKRVMYKEVQEVEKTPETKQVVEIEQPKARKPAKVAAKEPAKVGRKSWKTPGTNYVRMAFDTPIETKQKLKELLAVKFFGKYISQDEMINVALDEFIKKHTK
ncbi:MAG: hypothetical protein ACI85O_002688 [Saprospiraceae bacterium]|jgi:hypothetical protein